MAKLNHLIFMALYLGILFNTSLTAISPLYFLKSIGYDFSGIINFLIHRVNSATSTMILKLLGIKVYVYQKKGQKLNPKEMKGSILVTPNHIGELDPFFVGCVFSNMFPSNRRLQVFAKESIRWYPAIGWFMLASDALFVRYGKKRRADGQDYFVKQLLQDGDREKTILIFPEGGIKRPNLMKECQEKREEYKAPEYQNVMIPRTTGAFLIESKLDVQTQVSMTLRFVSKGKEDETIYDASKFVRGKYPDEVHILMEAEPVDKKKLNDRDQFDQDFYGRFKKIDDHLSESLDDWKDKYERIELVPKWKDLFWFFGLTGSMATPFFLYTNPYYLAFLASGVLFYYFKALRAFS